MSLALCQTEARLMTMRISIPHTRSCELCPVVPNHLQSACCCSYIRAAQGKPLLQSHTAMWTPTMTHFQSLSWESPDRWRTWHFCSSRTNVTESAACAVINPTITSVIVLHISMTQHYSLHFYTQPDKQGKYKHFSSRAAFLLQAKSVLPTAKQNL